MKLALFTDTYHPSTNGIVYVIDILYENLVALGHEVVIIAPRPGLRGRHNPKLPNKKVVWIPGVEGLLYDEYLVSVFSPTRTARKLSKMNFDLVMFFTPGQVGLLGAYVAKQNGIPLVEQYATDLVEYIKIYPSTLPALLALSASAPFALKMNLKEIAEVTRKLMAPRKRQNTWSQKTTIAILSGLHNSCDLVICVSEKSTKQLIEQGVKTKIVSIPTGVNRLPVNSKKCKEFKTKYNVSDNDFIVLYVGRLGKEKNLDMLLDAFKIVIKKQPTAKLVMVGDFDYREQLELKAAATNYSDRIVFTGRIPRHKLGNVFCSGDVFVFPSLYDTQALVLNEAACAGLPIVWCDEPVNEVVQNGINGILTKPRAKDYAEAIIKLINDEDLRQQYSVASVKIARQFTEKKMTKLLIKSLIELIETY